jgi:uncharacterized membrane protein
VRAVMAWRQAGYPVGIAAMLMAVYCLLVGSDRAGWVLGVIGVVLLALLLRAKPAHPESSAADRRQG